jgi:hypothetical protein
MPVSNQGLRASVHALVGVDELLLLVALGLITTGLWVVVGIAALIAPGLVLLWIALPSRTGFLVRASELEAPKRRDR